MSRILHRTFQCVTLLLTLLLWGASSPVLASPQSGGATPHEVFDRFKAASESKNWKEIAACLAPEALTEMNGMMVLMGGMMIAFSHMGEGMAEEMAEVMAEASDEGKGQAKQTEPAASKMSELEKKFEALLVSHGIDAKEMEQSPREEKEFPDALSSPKFFADIMSFMDELPSEEGQGSPGDTFPTPKGTLENVVIEGDRATATVGGEPGGFVRVDGRWYLDLEQGKDDGSDGMASGVEPEEGTGSK